MKTCAAIFGISFLSLAAIGQTNAPMPVGRTVYHGDGTRTESVSNPYVREMVETTFNSADQMVVRKVFLLNEKAEPVQGNVYDGRGNLVARCQCLYDELGRRKEDRLMNLNGEVFQIVVHEYGADGKPTQPKVVNVKTASAPTVRPAAVDFTTPQGDGSRYAPTPAGESGAAQPQQPAAPPPAEDKPKPNFFKRLFKK